MFSFLSRPKPSLRSQSSLILDKALFLFVFTLLAFSLLPTAYAQTRPGRWVAGPCDANGQSLPYASPDSNGFYEMNGTEQWIIKQTYFPDSVIDSLKANPDSSRDYLSAAYPLEYLLEPYASASIRYGGIGSRSSSGSPLGASAQNFYGPQSPRWWYSASPYGSGSLNGSVTVDVLGQLVSYFKVDWYDGYGGSAPADAVVPDYINLWLKTDIGASADVSFGSSGMTSGLSATATATDGAPFGEMATASAGDADAAPGPVRVLGSHLVRAAVDPSTRIAEVYLNGETTWNAVNTIPYGEVVHPYADYPSYVTGGRVTNGQTGASSGGYITARVKQDNRGVALSSPIEDSYYKGVYDVPHGTDRYLHLRDSATGNIAVDSVAEWHTDLDIHNQPTGYTKGWQINGLPITANASSFQDPSFTWSLLGLTTPQAWLQLPTATPKNPASFYLREPDKNKFPLQCTVRVDVSDNDGALASNNTYGITWHLPREAVSPTPFETDAGKYSISPARVGPVPDGGTSLALEATQPQHIDWEATIDGIAVVAKVSGQEEIAGGAEILAAITKVVKPYTDADGEPKQNGATSGDQTWGDAISSENTIYSDQHANGGNVPLNLINDPQGWHLCDMWVFQVVHFHDKYWYANGYDSHGYDGNSQHVVYQRNIDYVHDEYQFIQYRHYDGTPLN